MIDHIGIPVSDYARSKAFYLAVSTPIGAALVMEVPPEFIDGKHAAGFGRHGKPSFWIGDGEESIGKVHVAFTVDSRAAVDAFHAAALAAGATDNGAPGLRPHYHEHYYGAFVIDPDGHNIEAVCHAPESAT